MLFSKLVYTTFKFQVQWLGNSNFLQKDGGNSGNGLVRSVVQTVAQTWNVCVNTYATLHVHTAAYSADPEMQADWKPLGTEKGELEHTVLHWRPLPRLRKRRKDIKAQAAPERPHTTYPEVFQRLEENNGRRRKQHLLPFQSIMAGEYLSHSLLTTQWCHFHWVICHAPVRQSPWICTMRHCHQLFSRYRFRDGGLGNIDWTSTCTQYKLFS